MCEIRVRSRYLSRRSRAFLDPDVEVQSDLCTIGYTILLAMHTCCSCMLKRQWSGAAACVQSHIGSDPPESDGSLAAYLLRLRDPSTGQKISDERLLPHVGCISPFFWLLLPHYEIFGLGKIFRE